MSTITRAACVLILGVFLMGCNTQISLSDHWQGVQDFKLKSLQIAAEHAMEQQKTDHAESVEIDVFASSKVSGKVKVLSVSPESLSLSVTTEGRWANRDSAIKDFLRVELPGAMNMIARHSGLAVLVTVDDPNSSPELRIGVKLIGGNGTVEIRPIFPLVSKWDENTHELYFDWSFINYSDAADAVKALGAITALEFGFGAQKREPRRGQSDSPQSASVTLHDLRLVDYLQGSFDPKRHRWEADGNRPDLTIQHRCQEVTGIVARYGGDIGVKSSLMALDMAARTQNWDGSFYETRRGAKSVAVGEFTFGFTLHGLMSGYMALKEAGNPALDEKITIGGVTMSRDKFYQRIFYRGAMGRTAALPRDYRNDLIGGDTLMTGANRILGYAIAMKDIAPWIDDLEQRREILSAFEPIMTQLAAAQGRYSAGFPLLAEGDRYGGKGIHYDSGYTRTHMDWLVIGVRRTGDWRLVEMLRKYQTVFEAAMDPTGTGLLPMISERGRRRGLSRLIIPDATYQIGVQYNLPVIAQWGYNVSRMHWGKVPSNHFTHARKARGYSLGAHTDVLVDDMTALPEPADTGYRFPREFPVWSSYLYNKGGELVSVSRTIFSPDGTVDNDFKIDVGQYPETVGVPVEVSSKTGKVFAQAQSLSGWPTLLPQDAEFRLAGDIDGTARLDQKFEIKLNGTTRVVFIGPDVTLPEIAGGKTVPFRCELVLEPETAGQPVSLKIVREVK